MRLQALAHAPLGVVKERGREWVPLCLSYLSAKQPATHADDLTDALEHKPDTAPSASDAIGRTAAESAEDAEEGPGNAKIGARCALIILLHTQPRTFECIEGW